MGVVYTGRYNRISGVKNFAEIPVTVPALMPNETSWTGIPVRGRSSTGGTRLAVTTERVGAYTYSTQLAWHYPILETSIFVYELSATTAMPTKLIAEIPRPIGYNYSVGNVKVSPNGKYLSVMWGNRTGANAFSTTHYLYEIKADGVEQLTTFSSAATNVEWAADGEHYLATIYNTSTSYQEIILGYAPSGIVKHRAVATAYEYEKPIFVSGTDFMAWTSASAKEFHSINTTAHTTSKLGNVTGDFATVPQGTIAKYYGMDEGYIMKVATPTGSATFQNQFHIYSYNGGNAFKIGPALLVDTQYNQELTFDLNLNGDIFVTQWADYVKVAKTRTLRIGGAGLENLATHEEMPEHTAVLYNKAANRLVLVDHATVQAYPLGNTGFKAPRAPDEPRFILDLTTGPTVSRALYPLTPTFTNTVTETVEGAVGTKGTISFNSFNYLDFMSTEGTIEWWWRQTSDNNVTMFSFGNMSFQVTNGGNARVDLSLRVTGDGVHSSTETLNWNGGASFAPPNNWHHFLIARNGPSLNFYIDGVCSYALKPNIGAPDYLRQPPVSMFNNKPVTFSNGYFRDIRFTKGKASNLKVAAGASPIGFEPANYTAITGRTWVAPVGGKVTRL